MFADNGNAAIVKRFMEYQNSIASFLKVKIYRLMFVGRVKNVLASFVDR